MSMRPRGLPEGSTTKALEMRFSLRRLMTACMRSSGAMVRGRAVQDEHLFVDLMLQADEPPAELFGPVEDLDRAAPAAASPHGVEHRRQRQHGAADALQFVAAISHQRLDGSLGIDGGVPASQPGHPGDQAVGAQSGEGAIDAVLRCAKLLGQCRGRGFREAQQGAVDAFVERTDADRCEGQRLRVVDERVVGTYLVGDLIGHGGQCGRIVP